MASGGGEQSSREGCGEECRRQTISPPDPDATLRSMTSRSTVTRPVGRDVAKDYCGETPPASPAQQHRDATEMEYWRRRVVDVTVSYPAVTTYDGKMSFQTE